jgi:propanol-preferring alcohol dehydrogenase
VPEPAAGQVLLRVHACGVCRTDLHILDGELGEPKLPLVPGHQIVGSIERRGEGVLPLQLGERIGVPWLGGTCGHCERCTTGRENLCERARFTGYTLDGGYADYALADAAFCFPIPAGFDHVHAAPLLCAGMIGYRALSLCGDGRRVGLYGFGAAAHIAIQLLTYQGRDCFAFTRPGDEQAQRSARALGAIWAGASTDKPPQELDAALIFAPIGALVPLALEATAPGGTVVCAGIHMSDIPSFPYRSLWHERSIRSVANLTRKDGEEFLALASQAGVRTQVTVFGLAQANEALEALRKGRFAGAAVLRCS